MNEAMRLIAVATLLLAAGLVAPPPRATNARPPEIGGKVSAELRSDVSSIQPGKPFTLGVRFKIAPKWHIYWKNPGDSGISTEVKFDLPPGFKVDELRFPTPRVLRLPGQITCYGYEGEVMLLATVTPPEGLSSGSVQKMKARADWLECEEACVPGNADVTLELPVSDRAPPANQELFQVWSQRMPAHMGPGPWPLMSRPSGKGRAYELQVHWKGAPKIVEFIPGPSDDVSFHDIKVQADGNKSTITFRVEPLGGHTMPTSPIRCVVIASNHEEVPPTGLSFDIPMADAASLSSSKSSGKP